MAAQDDSHGSTKPALDRSDAMHEEDLDILDVSDYIINKSAESSPGNLAISPEFVPLLERTELPRDVNIRDLDKQESGEENGNILTGEDHPDFVTPTFLGQPMESGALGQQDSSESFDSSPSAPVVRASFVSPLLPGSADIGTPPDVSIHSELRQTYSLLSNASYYTVGSAADMREEDLHNLLWYPRDVRTSYEAKDYVSRLEKNASNKALLRDELHLVSREDFPNRLELLCKTLNAQNVSLDNLSMEGGLTETALDVAVIFDSNRSAKILIQHGGADLIMKKYRHSEYAGVTTLHLAIGKGNMDVITDILAVLSEEEKTKLFHIQPAGKHGKTWGLPLSMAACSANKRIFRSLLYHGADLLAKDRAGNSVFHCLAMLAAAKPQDACQMYQSIIPMNSQTRQSILNLTIFTEVIAWWCKAQGFVDSNDLDVKRMKDWLLRTENEDGYTPLTLATSLGAIDYAATILKTPDVYTFPQWQCGPEMYNFYDMSEIDTAVRVKGHPCVLELLAYSADDKLLRIADIPPLKAIIKHKWKAFRHLFFAWAIVHLLVMTIFTICANYRLPPIHLNASTITALNRTDAEIADLEVFLQEEAENKDYHNFIIIGELVVFIAAVVYMAAEIYDVAASCSDVRQAVTLLRLRSDFFRALLCVFSVSTLLLALAKMAACPYEDLLYAVVSISGWGFMLFFSRAFKNIGIFTVMLQRIVMGDMIHFTCVFMVFLCGFGTAILCLFQESPGGPPPEVATIAMTFISLFRFLVGLDELSLAEEAHLPWAYRLLTTTFIVLGNVLLLNMLIAAMSATYAEVSDQRENLWLKIRTRSVLMIERRLLPCMIPPHGLLARDVPTAAGRRRRLWLLPSSEMLKEHPMATEQDN